MGHEKCCVCQRRILSNKQKRVVGNQKYIARIRSYSPLEKCIVPNDGFICEKCHMEFALHKKINIKPVRDTAIFCGYSFSIS